MSESNHMTMREIARLFEGMTSNKIGRLLKQLGFRLDSGAPSPKAVELGLVSKRPVHWNEHYDVTTWHYERLLPHLIEAGLKPKSEDQKQRG